MSDPQLDTRPDTEPRDVDALRAESARLFAEHHALSRAFGERDTARRAAMSEALAAQRAAFDAEDRAWTAFDTAQAALRANPTDPALVADAEQASAAFETVRAAAHRAQEHTGEVTRRAMEESGRDVTGVLELGERARAAQDAYFAADWARARASQARQVHASLDEYAQGVVHRCRLAQAHNDGHPKGVWSIGEQLAVALVLRDRAHLDEMGYTPTQAAQRILGDTGMSPENLDPWLTAVRDALAGAR